MRSQYEIILWLLKRLGEGVKDHAGYYVSDPLETVGEIWDWIKQTTFSVLKTAKDGIMYTIENPRGALSNIWKWIKRNRWTILVVMGILVITVPLAVGFGPAGIAAGSLAAAWQSSIGAVAAGSAFAVLQSLAMTGVFTGVGAALIGVGGFVGLSKLLVGLDTLGASFSSFMQEFVHRSTRGVFGRLESSTQPSEPAEPPSPPPPKTNDNSEWKWLAGSLELPPSLDTCGFTSEEARILVLCLLACDSELPSLLHDADITKEERDSIWEALVALQMRNLGDADIAPEGSEL